MGGPRRTASFADAPAAAEVLTCLRQHGSQAASELLDAMHQRGEPKGPLLAELELRLKGQPGPRLLIDGLWFSRPYGGITRVWQQILATWQLDGLVQDCAPIAIIDRESCLSQTSAFPTIEASTLDPLDPDQVAALALDNGSLVSRWRADVFCSSWISSTGPDTPACPELAFVHDCMPERLNASQAGLLSLRRRWWQGAAALLTVSQDTASDLKHYRNTCPASIHWCHPAPPTVLTETLEAEGAEALWKRLATSAGLQPPFLLLPATSKIGSYKNPELVARALAASGVQGLQLVLCGLGASQRCKELAETHPHLRGRLRSVGFSDPELALAYHHACAVVIPSRIEGFGLPAVEAMAAGGLVMVADSRGLREAAGEAALRFQPEAPDQLALLLELAIDSSSRAWLQARLNSRVRRRLSRLHPDLLGLALLTQARVAAAATKLKKGSNQQ